MSAAQLDKVVVAAVEVVEGTQGAPFLITADLWFSCPCGAAFGVTGQTTFLELAWFVAEQEQHRPQVGPIGCPAPADPITIVRAEL